MSRVRPDRHALAVVTGARRGIGFAMAEALAAAGADIIGVSATIEPTGSAIERRRRPRTGRSFEASRCRLRRPRRRRRTRRRARRARAVDILVNNAGTIERAPAAEHPLELLGPRHRGRPVEPVRAHPGASAAADARARPRQDHLHRVAAELPGRHQRPGLRRGEVRHRRPDQGARERVGGARRQRQRASRPATSRPTTPRRCGTTRTGRRRSSTASRPAAGATPTTSPAPRSSSPRRASDYVSGVVLPVDGGWLGR